MINQVRTCSRCALDTSIPSVEIDGNGMCNHCHQYDELHKKSEAVINNGTLQKIIDEIKNAGKGKEYDSIIGVSGGIDSTYTLYMAKQLGLRPLAVHFDNGWNTEMSVNNIKNATNKLGVDLYTYVVDWEEFKDIQLSFLKASTSDSEIPTDIAIKAVLYKAAVMNKVKYIIYAGSNFRSEGKIPREWTYMDGKYIRSVQKMFGSHKIKSFPNMSFIKQIYYTYIKNIKVVRLVWYLDFKDKEVVSLLKKELDWKEYGGKHFESTYTKFFQTFILPVKFGIDKRKVHYSALIRSGQMTRDEVLAKLKQKPYNAETLEAEKEYIYKKFEITKPEFEKILNLPPKTYRDYPTYNSVTSKFEYLKKLAKKWGIWPELP